MRVAHGVPTGIAAITVADDGANTIVLSAGANARLTPADAGRASSDSSRLRTGSSATVRMNEDGTAIVSIGGVDIGQGALTAMAQLARHAVAGFDVRERG